MPKKRDVKQPALEPTRRSARVAHQPKVDYKEKNVKIIDIGISLSDSSSSEQEEIIEVLEQLPAESDIPKEKVKKPRKKREPVLRKRKFKKGKWNPDITLAKFDLYKNKPSHDLINDDSTRMTNLNMIRAVFTNDLTLMNKVFSDKKSISTLNAVVSPDINLTALDYLA
jgi:hypothetical protein